MRAHDAGNDCEGRYRAIDAAVNPVAQIVVTRPGREPLADCLYRVFVFHQGRRGAKCWLEVRQSRLHRTSWSRFDYYRLTGGGGKVIELSKLNGDLQKLHSPGFGSKRNRLVSPCASTIASASSRPSSPRFGVMSRTFSTTCVRWRGR